jgi:hypothetical protein
MSAYFRKSIKIAPGVHVNLSKRGTGVSFGGRGAHVSFSPTGRVTKTVSIPGTGIYYRDVDTLHSKSQHQPPSQKAATSEPREPEASTPIPAAHQVVAVEHHGFYISHGSAAFISLVAAGFIAIHYGTHPLSIWVPILGLIGGISLILWSIDLNQSQKEVRAQNG